MISPSPPFDLDLLCVLAMFLHKRGPDIIRQGHGAATADDSGISSCVGLQLSDSYQHHPRVLSHFKHDFAQCGMVVFVQKVCTNMMLYSMFDM